MLALSLQCFRTGAPTSIGATFPRASREELPSAKPSRSCTGSAPYPSAQLWRVTTPLWPLNKGTRSVQRWEDTMLGYLGNYFKGLGTSKRWKVCEAACTENTKQSVPNLLHWIFFSPQDSPRLRRRGIFHL